MGPSLGGGGFYQLRVRGLKLRSTVVVFRGDNNVVDMKERRKTNTMCFFQTRTFGAHSKDCRNRNAGSPSLYRLCDILHSFEGSVEGVVGVYVGDEDFVEQAPVFGVESFAVAG